MFWSGIDIGDSECVFLMNPVKLLSVDIYKRLFIFERTVRLDLSKAHFRIVKCASSFKEAATKEEVVSEMSNNGVLKVRPGQSWSDACSKRRRTARDVFFWLLGYKLVLSRFSVSTNGGLEGKEEIAQAQERLLKTVTGIENLGIS